MQTAIDTGIPFCSALDPLPGPPVDADGNFIPMAQWDTNNWPAHIHPPRGLPFVLPTETRIPASTPDAYVVQAILWLLKQAGGRCDRVQLAKAFALLSRPNWIREYASAEQKIIATEWKQAFNETGYEGLFGPVLHRMLGAEVVWRREGKQVFAVLAKPELLLDRPWIAADAQLVLTVLEELPASILTCRPMQQMEEEIEALLATG